MRFVGHKIGAGPVLWMIDPGMWEGDSVWGVQAGGRLDIPCIGLDCGGTSADELREAGAVEVCDSPASMLTRLDESAIAALTP